jgi:hypothetical protein
MVIFLIISYTILIFITFGINDAISSDDTEDDTGDDTT